MKLTQSPFARIFAALAFAVLVLVLGFFITIQTYTLPEYYGDLQWRPYSLYAFGMNDYEGWAAICIVVGGTLFFIACLADNINKVAVLVVAGIWMSAGLYTIGLAYGKEVCVDAMNGHTVLLYQLPNWSYVGFMVILCASAFVTLVAGYAKQKKAEGDAPAAEPAGSESKP